LAPGEPFRKWNEHWIDDR
jgi:hypothetical protein